MPQKKYHVDLSEDERAELEKLLKGGKDNWRKLTRVLRELEFHLRPETRRLAEYGGNRVKRFGKTMFVAPDCRQAETQRISRSV